ncbi:cytochrome P450 4C1-like [Periplaneta americana]|uniref:cytochrome P450 4C1-like n=1 Tax=Periplaneta americana TaxID=6978 RepID=UPI0037E929F9
MLLEFLAVVLVLFYLVRKVCMRRMVELAEQIPGPKTLPFIGNGLEFGTNTKDVFRSVMRLMKRYPSISRYWLGDKLLIMLVDREFIETVLSDFNNTLDKMYPYTYIKPWLGEGLITSTGWKWRKSRKLITPTFHFTILQEFVDVFNTNADILVEILSKHANGPEFDINDYITLYALDSLCETSMGVSIGAQVGGELEFVKAIRQMCDVFMARCFNPFLYPEFVFRLTRHSKKQEKCLAILNAFTDKVISERRKRLLSESSEQYDDTDIKRRVPFLDLLLQSEEGALLSDKDLRDEVNTMIFAGHDTTTSALGFAFWNLATHPDVQEKVMNELQEIFGDTDRPATFRDLQTMTYLEQVIKETLRLYPSVPVYGRKVKGDIRVGQYTIPGGASVVISVGHLHRDPRYFPDPEKFDPDRFHPENVRDRPLYSYIPFSSGPRNCVGQRYAMTMMKTVLSSVLRRYKLLPGDTPLKVVVEVMVKSLTGINIKLQLR